MVVLSSSVSASPGVKPFETFGKDSRLAQKAETRDDRPTGPAHIKIAKVEDHQIEWKVAKMVKLLRPSVQLPAGFCG